MLMLTLRRYMLVTCRFLFAYRHIIFRYYVYYYAICYQTVTAEQARYHMVMICRDADAA